MGNTPTKRKQFEKELEAALSEREKSEKEGALGDQIKKLRERHRDERGDSHSEETADAIRKLRDEWRTVETKPFKCTIHEIEKRYEKYEKNKQSLANAYRRNTKLLEDRFKRSKLFLDKQYAKDTKNRKKDGPIPVIEIGEYLKQTELSTSVWKTIKLNDYTPKKSRRVDRGPRTGRGKEDIVNEDYSRSLTLGRQPSTGSIQSYRSRRSSIGSRRQSSIRSNRSSITSVPGQIGHASDSDRRRLAASDPCIHAGFVLIPVALLLFFILRRWRSTSKPRASPQPEDELEAEYDRMHALL